MLPAPTNVQATVSSRQNVDVMITWDKLSDYFTDYLVSYTNTATNKSSEVNCGNRTSAFFDTLEQNTQYIITVQATTSDNRKSAKSKEVLVRTYPNGKKHIYTYVRTV